MESISKTRFLSFLGGKCLDRLEVEVIIQVQIVEVFTVNEKVKHVVALAANL